MQPEFAREDCSFAGEGKLVLGAKQTMAVGLPVHASRKEAMPLVMCWPGRWSCMGGHASSTWEKLRGKLGLQVGTAVSLVGAEPNWRKTGYGPTCSVLTWALNLGLVAWLLLGHNGASILVLGPAKQHIMGLNGLGPQAHKNKTQ